MESTAIQVKSLGKRYRIGLQEKQSDTFVGQIADILRSPLRNLKRLRGLSSFKGEDESVFWALKNVEFDVKEGEVLGVIGHNGAGKSTLLKILSQVTEPTEGEVVIRGRVSSLLEVGTGFHPDLTGRENIYMNGTILGMKKREIDTKLSEIIEFSGVSKYIDTPVKRYSSGMKVRLAFSVAAHLDPEVLIIDEVLAVGDAEFQKKCLGRMSKVAQEGRTVLFVSHQMSAISSLCSRVILLERGKVAYNGNVVNGITRYYNSISLVNLQDSQMESVDSRFKFRKVEFVQDDVVSVNNTILSNKDLTIKLHFSRNDIRLTDLKLAITFKDALGNKVFVLDNVYNEQVFEEKDTEVLYCKVDDLKLIPGVYLLDLWAASGSEVLEFRESCVELEVLSVNYFGHAKMKNQNQHGYFFIEHKWYS